MAFISLMHWDAIGTFEQATKDMIRRFRPSLRSYTCDLVASWFALYYTV